MSIIGWKQIYTNTLSAAATSVTIPNLHGDTDFEYRLEARIVNGYNGACNYLLQPNADAGATYGVQYVVGNNTLAAASRDVNTGGIIMCASSTLNYLCSSSLIIHAKSGFVRTTIGEKVSSITGTTVTYIQLAGDVWNNTADEITSMNIISDQTNGLGIGSSITLSVRAVLTTTPPTIPLEWV